MTLSNSSIIDEVRYWHWIDVWGIGTKVWDIGRYCIWDNWGENQDYKGEEKRKRKGRKEKISKIGDEHIVKSNAIVSGAITGKIVL